MILFLFIFFINNFLFLTFLKITKQLRELREGAFFSGGFVFFFSSYFFLNFDLQDPIYFDACASLEPYFPHINLTFFFYLDSIGLLFFILTSFLIFLCILFIFKAETNFFYFINLFLIEFFLLIVFSTIDLLFFYISFEAVLIPMYLMIGIFGSRERKVWASNLLFFYTICGSLPMLLSILYIYTQCATFNLYIIKFHCYFPVHIECILWATFFLSFASKIPLFPLHIWLPEAHVEAPTVGSVVLAGILLKLGVYGFFRFNLFLFPIASQIFSPYILIACGFGVIFASVTAARQIDFKRVIAYSSIAHMNLVVIGLFCGNPYGVVGAIFQSISHGFVASALFFLIGILYDRYSSRSLYFFSGLASIMPLYTVFFISFTLANISFPCTSSFIGEFILFLGSFISNSFITMFILLSVVLGGCYSLWLSNRILFGNLKDYFYTEFGDIGGTELFIVFSLLFFVILFGLFPFLFFGYVEDSIFKLFVHYYR